MAAVLPVCPACGAEYVSGTAECSDCHVALVEPTLDPDVILTDDDAVEIATTDDAAVARGWRDVLTAAGVGHRIGVSGDPDPETRTAYALVASEDDADWAAALADVVDEHPSLDARDAVRLARERMHAEPLYTSEADVALFDVPDLLPPPDVQQQIRTAETTATAGLVLAILFGCAAVGVSPWWAVPAIIAAVEAVRARRRGKARLAEWQQASGWEPPTR